MNNGMMGFPGGQGRSELTRGLGFGQAWRAVSRTSGVLYYNTSDNPIWVKAQFWASAPGPTGVGCTINGVDVGYPPFQCGSSSYGGMSDFLIPAGASYQVYYVNISSVNFFELR